MTPTRRNTGFSLCRFAVASLCTLAVVFPLVYVANAFAKTKTDPAAPPPLHLASPHLVVIKSKRVVYLFDAERLVRTYGCDLGSSPTGDKRRIGDGKTPIGQFRIVSKNKKSPYHRFLGLDYPHAPAVAAGLAAGVVSPGAAQSILDALSEARCPDWSTALGGGIGIHGHRRGRDWTGGCVALSNTAVDELFDLLRIGDQVEILP